jgi:tripartite-type tricarboxylate transporter receptor subunit TctC
MLHREGSKTIIAMIAFFVLMVPALSVASDYPIRPITLIVPQSPGGTFDIIARSFAPVAEKLLGQPFVVSNKPGASGMIGGLAIVQAPPDGYTIAMDSTGMGSAVEWETANGRKPPFTRNDFIKLGCLSISTAVVVVPQNSPWKTLADMIRDCKAKPNHYAFGSGGLYGGTHLPTEILMRATGIKARHVPYKGGGPALTALVGEHVHFSTQWDSATIPYVTGKKLRILAVQGDKRLKSLPDIPTVKELGIDAQWQQWFGISISKKTPAPIITRLKEIVKKVSEDETFVRIIETQGGEVRYMTGEELDKFCEVETARTAKLFKDLVAEEKK